MRRLLLVMGTALLLAAPADAATVTTTTKCGKRDGCSHVARFTAAPGERNELTVTREASAYVFRDARNPVAPGRYCTTVDEHAVRCDAPLSSYPSRLEPIYADARLGDGDDVATATSANVDGGPGDDRIEGTFGTLSGGPGSDDVRALRYSTYLRDGDGARPARDRYQGTGETELSYEWRRAPVRVDLRRTGPYGSAGEGDVATGIRDVVGGSGDDVLIGDGRENRIVGGLGADRLTGGAGNDVLDSGSRQRQFAAPEADVLRGGPGRDQLDLETSGGPGPSQQASCGSGRDEVTEPRPGDRVGPACERVSFGLQDVRLHAVMRRVRAAFAISVDCVCRRATLEVRTGGREIAAARARNRRVALRLNALGRRLLAARRSLRVMLLYREYGSREGFSTRLSLRPGR